MIDIASITGASLTKVWEAISQVLSEVTLRIGPTSAYNGVTDATTVTWTSELAIDAFLWKKKQAEKEGTAEKTANVVGVERSQMALVRVSDLGGAVPDVRSTLTHGDDLWNIIDVDQPPGNAIIILTLRK